MDGRTGRASQSICWLLQCEVNYSEAPDLRLSGKPKRFHVIETHVNSGANWHRFIELINAWCGKWMCRLAYDIISAPSNSRQRYVFNRPELELLSYSRPLQATDFFERVSKRAGWAEPFKNLNTSVFDLFRYEQKKHTKKGHFWNNKNKRNTS